MPVCIQVGRHSIAFQFIAGNLTQDQEIHKKAKKIGQDERVLSVHQAISVLKEDIHGSKLYPNIREVACHSLDLKNQLFNSLRDAYDDFDNWFKKCAREGRRAWIVEEDKIIHALCIFNMENSPIITNDKRGLIGKVLKLCTFKVEKRGYKIGELLLKQAFSYAVKNSIDHIYVTIEPEKHDLLEDLFLDFGFYLYGTDSKDRDNIFVKDFPTVCPIDDCSPLEYAIKYFPKIKITTNSVYIIPIQPKYHETLFPEKQMYHALYDDESSSAGNTIKKAYLSNSNTKTIKSGDIVFFYRTSDLMAITSYGIVDQFYIEKDPEKIFQWVSKRTVYTNEEIKSMRGKDIKIILFRLVGHLDKPLEYNKLKQLMIINGAIQSVTKIDQLKANKIINEANIYDSVLSN